MSSRLITGESLKYGVNIELYAIIETGGKQYRVQEGDSLSLEKLPALVGETVEIGKVLAAVDGEGALLVGDPYVDGAAVQVKVTRHGRGKKIIVFKYKSKKNYRRKQGHRQAFTQVTVEKIELKPRTDIELKPETNIAEEQGGNDIGA